MVSARGLWVGSVARGLDTYFGILFENKLLSVGYFDYFLQEFSVIISYSPQILNFLVPSINELDLVVLLDFVVGAAG